MTESSNAAGPKDPIGESRAILKKQRENLASQIAYIDGILERMNGLQHPQLGLVATSGTLPTIERGSFKGFTLSRAFEAYLRDRRGQKIPFQRAVDDLLQAGVDPGAPRVNQSSPEKLLAHNLKILMANRPRYVAWSPDSKPSKIPAEFLTVWLAPTADSLPEKRPKRKRRAARA